jgi:hypothetical protein
MIASMLIVGDGHVQLHNAPIGDKGMSIWGLGAGLMLRHAVVKAALDSASK